MENKEWLEWRKKGLGASDAPIIMGVSPWKTRYKLWAEKVGLAEPEQGNWATQRGHDLEPVARAQYELESGLSFPVKFYESEVCTWLRASLDGYNEEHNIILEIKCPSKEDHEKAVNGEVPEKYIPQLQHQLLVVGAVAVHYISYHDGKIAKVEVFPDYEYQKKLLAELRKFWELVETKTEPERTNKDYVPVIDNELLVALKTYRDLVDQKDDLETKIDMIKKIILDHKVVKANSAVTGNGLLVQKITRKGNVNYKDIGELKNVDLEKYRGKDTIFYQIKKI